MTENCYKLSQDNNFDLNIANTQTIAFKTLYFSRRMSF